MIDTANISARIGHLNRSYVDKLYDEADRIRRAMEEEAMPVILDMYERQLREIEDNIERLEDDQVVTEDDLLDFAFWYLETYAILSVLLRRWVIIGWRFGADVMGYDAPILPSSPGTKPQGDKPNPDGDKPAKPGQPQGPSLPPIGPDDPRVTSLVEQMRTNNDHLTTNLRKEVRSYLDSVEAMFGRDLRGRTAEVILHFRQYFERHGTSVAEMNANAAFLRGYLMAMIAAGVSQKQWVSQRDSRVRKSHVEADGQIVSIRAPFIVGDAPLLHPVDPKGPPQEIMRCRCFMVPVTGTPFPEGPQPNVGF